ncbi:hypothetical protein TcCL_ESM01876 [Trypanosoma cruzi]|nr:hypothetical protein TcCL_ESM01876 [Trypanosoma cruzi]
MLHGGKQTPPRPSINQSQAACLFMDSPFWFQPRRKAFVAQHQPRVASCRKIKQVWMAERVIGEIALKCGKRHRTRRKQVRMMSLHVSCAVCQMKENFGETEVSALTSTPGSFIRMVESSIRGLHTS